MKLILLGAPGGGKLVRRKDDALETVRERLTVYHRETEPLVDFYTQRGLLRTAGAYPAVAENTQEILRVLQGV